MTYPSLGLLLILFLGASQYAFAQAQSPKTDTTQKTMTPSATYDWKGYYLGVHSGYAWGHSHWSTVLNQSNSLNLWQPFNSFFESGSFFNGLEAGFNWKPVNHFVLGAEIDSSYPSWPNLSGISIGGEQNLISPLGFMQTYLETVMHFGTVRGRLGYTAQNWLIYVTAGFAWTYDQLILTQPNSTDSLFLWRLGWAGGAGLEVPLIPNWTAKLEYRLADYGKSHVTFANADQRFTSNFLLQDLRIGLNYWFDKKNDQVPTANSAWLIPNLDKLRIHSQATLVWQGYPTFHSAFEGTNSLPGRGQGRETFDLTFFLGLPLWQGAEVWVNPEIDQGFGIGNTHGVAGYTTAESFKLGSNYPYARFERYFIRQTLNLGGEIKQVEEDLNRYDLAHTENYLVLTIGRYYVTDIFDTNKYANSSKNDFLNWSLINIGSFDYGGDGWGTTYGATAEWYQDRFTFRGGYFDMSITPSGGGDSAQGTALDPTFQQFELIGEIEERHQFLGQPGKFKITGFIIRGRTGNFREAVLLSKATGLDASDALAVTRRYISRPGASINLEQQLSENVGFFARAGWVNGNVEPWDVTDIDRSLQAGLSISGKKWNRPNDTIGIGGVINNIFKPHQAYFNAGGLGIIIGDGMLPNPRLEKILEAFYNYTLTKTTLLSFDYQYVANPAYNGNRGPVNVFAGRLHWQF
jgi:high affinity Mn2+ porin